MGVLCDRGTTQIGLLMMVGVGQVRHKIVREDQNQQRICFLWIEHRCVVSLGSRSTHCRARNCFSHVLLGPAPETSQPKVKIAPVAHEQFVVLVLLPTVSATRRVLRKRLALEKLLTLRLKKKWNQTKANFWTYWSAF
jgi:hypothetical protein